MTDTFDLATMIADRETGTPGNWLYRPQKYDDWGVVRSEYDADGGYYTFICQARDPRFWGDECLNDHRRNKTDPWSANARRIARVPAMEAEILRLREELATTRKYALQDAADACRARADMMDGVDMECCEGTANNCASDIEALMEALYND